jgi:hypothetical protein
MMDILIGTIFVVFMVKWCYNRLYTRGNTLEQRNSESLLMQPMHHYVLSIAISYFLIYDFSKSNVTRRVPLVEHELLTQPKQASSLRCFVEIALPNPYFPLYCRYWITVNCFKNSEYLGPNWKQWKRIPEFSSLRHVKLGSVCNISI